MAAIMPYWIATGLTMALLWAWWAVGGFIFFPVGGMVLGWFTAKFGD